MAFPSLLPESASSTDKPKARKGLLLSALFLGELRDGLTMINMQSAFLIISKNYQEKQAGILFLVFGMSQFLFQTPAGYLFDYTRDKVQWLSIAGVATTALTLFTAFFAADNGGNLGLMIFVKFLQGAVASFIPPGLNSITRGIVGGSGMTEQVAVNEMMNHLGTAIIVLIGSVLGYFLYPGLGMLFAVSPIACLGFLYFLTTIPPSDIDHDAARGLDADKDMPPPSTTHYSPPSSAAEGATASSPTEVKEKPSFNLGWKSLTGTGTAPGEETRAETPFKVLQDPSLLIFIVCCFLFHMSNGTVLPLVMQTLAIGGGRAGILMSGLCIIVAQVFMVVSARICGEFSGKYGRKPLFLIGLFSVPLRCLILTSLLYVRGEGSGSAFIRFLILATQILDGVGAGCFGTMYILVTSDLSRGTGRFNMTLGMTTAAMSIGGTVSGYLGEALAQDLGYMKAYFILMILSLAPALMYSLVMPETLKSDDSAGSKMTSIDEDGAEKGKAYQELV